MDTFVAVFCQLRLWMNVSRGVGSIVEEIVSICIAIGRSHRLNNGCVMESVLPETRGINVGSFMLVIITAYSRNKLYSKQSNYELWTDTDGVASIQDLKPLVSGTLKVTILGNYWGEIAPALGACSPQKALRSQMNLQVKAFFSFFLLWKTFQE